MPVEVKRREVGELPQGRGQVPDRAVDLQLLPRRVLARRNVILEQFKWQINKTNLTAQRRNNNKLTKQFFG